MEKGSTRHVLGYSESCRNEIDNDTMLSPIRMVLPASSRILVGTLYDETFSAEGCHVHPNATLTALRCNCGARRGEAVRASLDAILRSQANNWILHQEKPATADNQLLFRMPGNLTPMCSEPRSAIHLLLLSQGLSMRESLNHLQLESVAFSLDDSRWFPSKR